MIPKGKGNCMPDHLLRLILVFLTGSLLSAQDFRATIVGHVTDPAGAAIPDAKVRAIQRGTNQVTEVQTSKEGSYTLPYLAPSTYDIEVTAEGFQKLRRENVTLMVAEKLDLPLKLELGRVTEQITVTADIETVSSADASGGLNFDAIQDQKFAVAVLNLRAPSVLLGFQLGGILGYAFLNEYRVGLDFNRGELRLRKSDVMAGPRPNPGHQ